MCVYYQEIVSCGINQVTLSLQNNSRQWNSNPSWRTGAKLVSRSTTSWSLIFTFRLMTLYHVGCVISEIVQYKLNHFQWTTITFLTLLADLVVFFCLRNLLKQKCSEYITYYVILTSFGHHNPRLNPAPVTFIYFIKLNTAFDLHC